MRRFFSNSFGRCRRTSRPGVIPFQFVQTISVVKFGKAVQTPPVVLCMPGRLVLASQRSTGSSISSASYAQRNSFPGKPPSSPFTVDVATSLPTPLDRPSSLARRGIPIASLEDPPRFVPLCSSFGALGFESQGVSWIRRTIRPFLLGTVRNCRVAKDQKRLRATAMARQSHENQSPNPLRSPNGVPTAKRTAPAPPPEAYAASSRNYSLGCTLIPLVNRLQDIFAQVRMKRFGDTWSITSGGLKGRG